MRITLRFFSCVSLLLCLSCLRSEDPIGDYPVFLKLDLQYHDKVLQSIPSYKIYSHKTHHQNLNYHRGFGFGGVLVVHGNDFESNNEGFYAFELACPYEASRDVLIEPDENVVFAVCPQCKTQYDIINGTGLSNGVSRHGLKKYRVNRPESNTLIIRN